MLSASETQYVLYNKAVSLLENIMYLSIYMTEHVVNLWLYLVLMTKFLNCCTEKDTAIKEFGIHTFTEKRAHMLHNVVSFITMPCFNFVTSCMYSWLSTFS